MNHDAKNFSVSLDRSKRTNSINRRSALRALGVSLALPSLQIMGTASASLSNNPISPVRLAWVFFPNGTNAERWFPKGAGKDWEFSSSLAPLSENRNDLNILKGLAQVNAQSLGDGPGDHARSAAAFLTGAHPYKTEGAKIKAGRSVDQIAADVYGRSTRLASLELGTEQGRDAGACDSGYACAYSNNISWRSEHLPTAKEINPQKAFQRLFGGGDGQSGDPRANKVRKSILDFVSEQRTHLESISGSEDRRKLEEYFASIREIEQRIAMFSTPVKLPDGIVEPTAKPENATEHIRLMYDLMVLAFQTDTTRLASFMLANEGSNRTFPMIEIKDGHHSLSHHENKIESIEKIAKIDTYYAEQFSYFLNKLKSTKDADGNTLLDNSLIVYGGCISDGNRHDHHNLPLILAGKGGRNLPTGRLLEFPEYTPMNNLFSTMLEHVGMESIVFGDGTGKVRLA
jgi:hypothetical protein